jgi:hypothetical protein
MSDVAKNSKQWPSWHWTKRALGCLVLTVQGVALYSGELPYFPIEVSRTAATTTLNRWLFPAGAVALVPVACLCDGATPRQLERYLPAWLGLVSLAWLDDTTYPVGHIVAVALMACGLLWAHNHNLAQKLAQKPLQQLLQQIRQHNKLAAYFGVLYAFHGLLKLAAVVFLEPPSCWWSPWEIAQRAHSIGQGTCDSVLLHPWTLGLFRLSGVVQWVALGALSFLLP